MMSMPCDPHTRGNVLVAQGCLATPKPWMIQALKQGCVRCYRLRRHQLQHLRDHRHALALRQRVLADEEQALEERGVVQVRHVRGPQVHPRAPRVVRHLPVLGFELIRILIPKTYI